jgi:hypothetical protein
MLRFGPAVSVVLKYSRKVVLITWNKMGRACSTNEKMRVGTTTNVWVPQNAGKFLSSCTTGGFPRRAQRH